MNMYGIPAACLTTDGNPSGNDRAGWHSRRQFPSPTRTLKWRLFVETPTAADQSELLWRLGSVHKNLPNWCDQCLTDMQNVGWGGHAVTLSAVEARCPDSINNGAISTIPHATSTSRPCSFSLYQIFNLCLCLWFLNFVIVYFRYPDNAPFNVVIGCHLKPPSFFYKYRMTLQHKSVV